MLDRDTVYVRAARSGKVFLAVAAIARDAGVSPATVRAIVNNTPHAATAATKTRVLIACGFSADEAAAMLGGAA